MSAAHTFGERQRFERGEAGVALPAVEGKRVGLLPALGDASALQCFAALGRAPGRLVTSFAALAGSVAQAVTARAVFTLMPEALDEF